MIKYILPSIALMFLLTGGVQAKQNNYNEGQWGDCIQTACGVAEGTQTCVEKEKTEFNFVHNFPGRDGKCKVGDTKECTVDVADACPVVASDDDSDDNDKCDKPGKVQGFRTFPTHSLKWNKKDSFNKVDIRAYNADGSFAYNIRTADDGDYDLGGLNGTFFKMRGMNSCGLGKWSTKISF